MATSIEQFQYVERQINYWDKQTRDIQNYEERPGNARDIGFVNINDSRLNLITALHDGDTVDYFKFTATSRGEVQLTYAINEGVTIEVYNKLGTKIGDSSDEGTLEFTPIELGDDEDAESYTPGAVFVTLDPGEYYIKVVRDSDVPKSEHLNYQLQLQMGDTYGNAYQVIETRAADPAQERLAAQFAAASSTNTTPGSAIASVLGSLFGSVLDALKR